MATNEFRQVKQRTAWLVCHLLCFCWLVFASGQARAQQDQGTITGVVQDTSGAVISGAQITLTNTDTGLILKSTSSAVGIYNFPPLKIGNYALSARATGFKTTTQNRVHLDVQQRLNVVLVLVPGAVTETVTVSSAPPLLETQEATIAEVMSTQTINDMPLNGRNWVYVTQLSAGTAPSVGSRGNGNGDFEANGQPAEQNDFIMDGVDNNENSADFLNGASYVVRPPPDALAEVNVETSNYSAEFGHSAGAVVNATIKSGTNQIHGNLWEYVRNNDLDAKDWNATAVLPYHENQFGATLGMPILRNKLFFFGDAEANRIVYSQPSTVTVPTLLMRQGDFSELLSTSETGSAQQITLYQPNSGGAALLSCNGQQNVFCSSQVDSVAQTILNLYPKPNANSGHTYSNYVTSLNDRSNTWQWDMRLDYNLSDKDQMFARFSYLNAPGYIPGPLGPPLGGGSYNAGKVVNRGENFAFSETHIFNSTLTNEFRLGYSYGFCGFLQDNDTVNIAATLGFGETPFGPGYPYNGGMPTIMTAGIATAGSPAYNPILEHQNAYQIMDNVTMLRGRHSLRAGLAFESLRYASEQPAWSHGSYYFSGVYTSNVAQSFTGYGVADMVADQNNVSYISPIVTSNDVRWYRSAYVQDDWRITQRMTVNLGLRYDYFQPYREMAGEQANLYPSGPLDVGTGSAIYEFPSQSKNVYLAPWFLALMAKDNITLQFSDNPALSTTQKADFSPRVGFSYQFVPNTVVRFGWGMFYGGLQNVGGSPNLVNNYPYEYSDSLIAGSCLLNNCPSNGITFETGFSAPLSVGLANYPATPWLVGEATQNKPDYTMEYNLALQRSLTPDLTATLAYVGSASRHMTVLTDFNSSAALVNPAISTQTYQPFPDFGGIGFSGPAGVADYNSMQLTLQRRFSKGLSFLASYTWSHSLDDVPAPLGSNADSGLRQSLLLPVNDDYSNSAFDVRNRVTFNTVYELPFGNGRKYLNNDGKIVDLVTGGWRASLTFIDQSGPPISIYPNIATAAGGTAYAIRVRDPFAAGGSPDPTNPGVTCAAHTKTKTNWFNPCSFANPLPGSNIALPGSNSSTPSQITDPNQVLSYLGGRRNGIPGPGFERVNLSLFKDFPTFEGQSLEFRADTFNLFNTPSYGVPAVSSINSNGGLITGSRFFQNYTPDARFFQLSLKYAF